MGDPSQQYSLAMAGAYPDISQWSNPYSQFKGQALPFPPGYVGSPTNAMGQPIASYQAPPQPAQGTTLNSTPAKNTGWNQNPVGSPLNPMGDWTQLAPQLPGASPQGQANYAYNLGLGGFIDPTTHQASMGSQQSSQGAGGGQASGGGTTGSAPGAYQSALNALGNPGQVMTPGAAWTPMSGGANAAQSSGILNNFLQNWQQGGIGKTAAPGIGGGSSGISVGANSPFFAALKGAR
jgi:hypothetical protein